jgi:hypothetical protein
MTKKDVQKRVLQNGKPLALSKFSWDKKTQTFSTVENDLVLDFKGINSVTFKTNSNCTFKTGHYCTFKTDHYCTFNTGSNCNFNTGIACTFHTDIACTFHTNYNCNFKTGFYCTFKTGSNCTFDTGFYCTFKTGSNCTFDTGPDCVIVRRDIFEIIQLLEEENFIQLCPYNIKGYIRDGIYSETGNPVIIADGIFSEILSKKESNNFTIYRVINNGRKNRSFLLESGGIYSHGGTVKEAKESFIYKIGDQDTSVYAGYTLETVMSLEEAIKMYRVITGACEYGTRSFVESLERVPRNLSVQEVIKLTEGHYGNKTIKNFFIKE